MKRGFVACRYREIFHKITDTASENFEAECNGAGTLDMKYEVISLSNHIRIYALIPSLHYQVRKAFVCEGTVSGYRLEVYKDAKRRANALEPNTCHAITQKPQQEISLKVARSSQ